MLSRLHLPLKMPPASHKPRDSASEKQSPQPAFFPSAPLQCVAQPLSKRLQGRGS